jgi:hypothetical protein
VNRQCLNPRKWSGTATRATCFGPALLALLLSHAVAQDMPAPEPTEPEAHWIYPLGGRPDTRLKAEVEGRLLQEVHAVWSPEPGLEGAILEIRPVSEQKKEGSEKGGYGDKGKAPTQRVTLELEIDPDVPSGVHSLHLVSGRGMSNPLSFLVSSDPVMEESEITGGVDSKPRTIRPPVILNGRLSRDGEVDSYALEVTAGEDLAFQLFSPAETFRQILRLYSDKGSWLHGNRPAELEFSHKGSYRPSPAKHWRHRFDRGGRYLIGVGSVYGRAEPEFVYQLRIVPAGDESAYREWPGSEGPVKWSERRYLRELTPNRLRQLWARTVKPAGDAPRSTAGPESDKHSRETTGTPGPPGPSSNGANPAPVVFEEKEPNGNRERAPAVSLPALISGSIEASGDVDFFRFQLSAGQTLVFEVETPRVSPPAFSPSLKVLDSAGHPLFDNKHRKIALTRQDPIFLVELLKLHLPDRGSCSIGSLAFFESLEAKMVSEFGVAGEYTLQIGDLTSQQGHSDHAYRVLIRPAIPHVGELELEGDRINLTRGQVRTLKVTTGLEEGYSGQVALSLEGLPPGVAPLTGTEVELPSPIGPTTESRKSFLGFSEKAVILLRADEQAPLTDIPVRVKVWARPAVDNELGARLPVGEFPLMVIDAREQASGS